MKYETKEIIKASLRRLVRNFLGTFLVLFITAVNTGLNQQTILQNFTISIKNGFITLWSVMVYPAILSAFVGAFTAVTKLARDILRENGWDKIANKFIF